MAFVPVGSTQGVGLAFGWKIPSFVVKMAKAKDFMKGKAPKLIEGQAEVWSGVVERHNLAAITIIQPLFRDTQ